MIGNPNKTYLIAEIGVNHGGDIDLAKQLIVDAKKGGAHCAKFQTYKASTLASKHSPAYWDTEKEPTKSQFELFSKYDSFGEEEYKLLHQTCVEQGIDFLSTPFDTECLSWLADLMPFIKIASADLTNYILMEEIAKFRKPVLMSVGASTLDEIQHATNHLIQLGIKDIVLLHCMLLYPTPLDKAYLSQIKVLQRTFESDVRIEIGYSDHVPSDLANNDQIISARAMGARVIEKHFTHDKSLQGNDHYHALDLEDLSALSRRLEQLDYLLGEAATFEDVVASQSAAINEARRSLVYNNTLKKGHIITKQDLIPKRPGHGISPKSYEKIVGKTLLCDVEEDNLIKLEHFK